MWQREKVKRMLAELEQCGIIRDSCSPYASPILLVDKGEQEDRMCIDYRGINKITKRDKYPLPVIEDQIDRLGGNTYFTSLDLKSGFYQIPMHPDSVEKTAFITPDGHYEFLRMPFGLANAPSVFQRAINKAPGDLRFMVALVYMDDILIPAPNVEKGFENLGLVLDALRRHNFTLM